MRTTRLTPEDHDRLLADVSHLPHALAASLVLLQSDRVPLAGKGFLDTTRIAAGDPGLWRNISSSTMPITSAIRSIVFGAPRTKGKLDPSRAKELAHWLDQASTRRRNQ